MFIVKSNKKGKASKYMPTVPNIQFGVSSVIELKKGEDKVSRL